MKHGKRLYPGPRESSLDFYFLFVYGLFLAAPARLRLPIYFLTIFYFLMKVVCPPYAI